MNEGVNLQRRAISAGHRRASISILPMLERGQRCIAEIHSLSSVTYCSHQLMQGDAQKGPRGGREIREKLQGAILHTTAFVNNTLIPQLGRGVRQAAILTRIIR